MSMGESWQTAEIPGPIKAVIIPEAKRVAAILKSAKRLLLIVGNEIIKQQDSEFDIIQYITEIAKVTNAHINVTGTIIHKFREKGYDKVFLMPALEIVDRLRDETWMGHDNVGRYTLAVFMGFPYYYEWLLLNGMKHFAYKNMKTLSLDPYYQPNATFSLPNMRIDEWRKFIRELVENLRR